MKIHFLFSFLLIFALQTHAQNTSYFTFNNQYYTINKIIKTTSNNYVAVATNAYGRAICKLDPVFKTVWCKRISKNNFSHVLDLAETNNGNFALLVDNVDSSFVYKFNDQGTLLALKYFTSNTINFFTPTNLCNSIIGDGILLTGGYCNVENYCIRLDDNLNVLWQYQYRDGTGTCANSRSSDIISENTRYTFVTNPSSGGADLISIYDDGTVASAQNFNLQLQAGAYPMHCIRLFNGAIVASWVSPDVSLGTQYIFIDSTNNNASVKKYNLGFWNYTNEYIEFENNKILIGGTNITTQNGAQTNLLHAVDNTGKIMWSKTSASVANANSPSQINCFAKGLDNSVFAFGGSGLDGAYGAKLNFGGDGFCNSSVLNSSILTTDSVTATNRTITRLNLTALVTGNAVNALIDTTLNKTIVCGILDNTPLQISNTNALENIITYPNPFINEIIISEAKNFVSLKLYNALGNEIKNFTVSKNANNVVSVNTFKLPTGNYFIKIIYADKTVNYKIVKL